jgi:hypothetical protein
VPLNSVQQYVKGLLNGMTIPGPTGMPSTTLTAWVTPPVYENLNGPRAHVWGGRKRVTRQTAPRGPGFRHYAWTIDIYLVHLANPNDTGVDQAFPLLVDAVEAQLGSTPMGAFITDPTTGVKSQVLEIGEDWETDVSPIHTPASNRMLYYTARIGMDIYEAVQG